MNPIDSSPDNREPLFRSLFTNSSLMRTVQTRSRIVKAIFIIALVWAIYQAAVNNNPLPIWAWLGILTLLAVAIGLGVALLVYRSVAKEGGPFDFRPSGHITGQLHNETRRVEREGANALRAEIKMTQGVLHLMGGATAATEATFTYDDADWKPPDVEYAVDAAGQGSLMVKQRATHRPAMRRGAASGSSVSIKTCQLNCPFILARGRPISGCPVWR